MTLPTRRMQAALHEAAHAVARIALDLYLHSVTVSSDGTGRTRGVPVGEETEIDRSVMAKVAMAGPAVEQRWLDHDHDEMLNHWAAMVALHDDHDVSAAGMDALAGYHWASGLLSIHWDAVEALAAVLAERLTVSGDEARAVVGPLSYDENEVRRHGPSFSEEIVMRWVTTWWNLEATR